MRGDEAALAGRVRTEIQELMWVVERVEQLLAKANERQDDDYLDGVALNLHGFYAGVERIFVDIAREVDGAVPSGPEWHRDLLIQMSAELIGTRLLLLDVQPASAWKNTAAFATLFAMYMHSTYGRLVCRNSQLNSAPAT
jgi:hypothetical protein